MTTGRRPGGWSGVWLGLALVLGCSSSDGGKTGGGGQAAGPRPGPEEWNREVVPPSDEEAAAARASCGYRAGALAAETQGASFPMGDDIPIDHMVVVMMENRSFDHYFQKLPEYGQPDVDVAPADFSNLDRDGNPTPIFHQEAYCFVDTNHGYGGTHTQVNGGLMDGFVTTNEGNHEMPAMGNLEMFHGRRAMGYYDETDIPFYYWLANEFSVADRYFSSLPGPTLPNRMYLYAATSYGKVHNSLPGPMDLIVDYLDAREIEWKIYAEASPAIAIFVSRGSELFDRVVPIEQYYEDAAAGTLPPFAFVDPGLGIGTGSYDNDDEHPPALAQIGQRFVADVVKALTESPLWSRSALMLTYDEHGGLYDHVEPPPACVPDDVAPETEPGDPEKPFDRLGIRVPLIVVSPFAKKHHVSHEIYDHTSILKLVEARWVMPALTHRDANALAPWDMFDFDDPPHLDPPAVSLPPIPDVELEACGAVFE
ncbi:MAG: alkaline phosphatase family protein [Polyangiaceae bacterium]